MRLLKGHQVEISRTSLNKEIKSASKVGRKKTGKYLNCAGCGISFYRPLSRIVEYGNFHTPECYKKYRLQTKELPWNRDVYEKNSGENNHNYKDIMVSESALHKWVRYCKGAPLFCVDCGITKEEEKFLDWSNQSGLYLRDLDDFVGRCRSCHKKYDEKLGFPRKKSFNEKGQRIGITIFIPREYGENWKEIQNASSASI